MINTFSLLTPVFVAAYVMPPAIVSLLGPTVAQRYGGRGLTALVTCLSVCAGTVDAILGALHRAAMRSGGFDALGLLGSSAGIGLLLLGPSVAIWVLRRRGKTVRLQISTAGGISLALFLLSSPLYFFGLACILTGECL